jgi:hypothetical protein
MVVQIFFGSTTTYMHSAFASDANGTDFSFTEFEGAVYVGNYTSNSATESTDPQMYNWHVIGNIDNGAVQDVEDGIDPDVYALREDVGTLTVRQDVTDNDIATLQDAVWNTEE